MLDIVIENGTVVDGTGRPAFKAEVGVVDGRVAIISEKIQQEAACVIDAHGLHMAPGFIDPHTHSDLPLLVNPQAESKIRQGVTTEIIGNCGFSPAPLLGASEEEVRARARKFDAPVDWTTMGEYLDRLRGAGAALNVVALVGHNTVRGSVLGYGDVQPTPEQQAEMERRVAQAIEEGARGFSTGLYYPPGYYAKTEEVIGLARAAARHGGIYATHMRSESDLLLEAVAEAIEIGEQAEIDVEISHLKVEGYRNWDDVDRLEEMLDDGGLQVGCDQYPYIACSTWLSAILPYWAQAGGARAVAERLRNPEVRAQLRQDWRENREEWDSRSGVREWSDILVSDYQPDPDLQGKTIEQIAGQQGDDPLETVFDLIMHSEGQAACVWFTQLEENVQRLMRHPLVVIGSDGSTLRPDGVLGRRKVHPRSYGTFPRVLGHYVREEQVLSLEEAVRKMTSITAERFGLTDRGSIREGAWADLVLFDAQTVNDQATFTDPHRYPVGIPYVLVNGDVVIDQHQHTGALPGQVL
ncbi:MAG: D-aminoacylase [Anaerolineales bacterium]|nr:D-aminoacylase [Anaerolineales bacterium]